MGSAATMPEDHKRLDRKADGAKQNQGSPQALPRFSGAHAASSTGTQA